MARQNVRDRAAVKRERMRPLHETSSGNLTGQPDRPLRSSVGIPCTGNEGHIPPTVLLADLD